MSQKVNKEMRYIPNIEPVPWDVNNLDKETKKQIKSRLVAAIIHDEDEYRALLSYFHKKFPDLMDYEYGDGKQFQWKYLSYPDKIEVYDKVAKRKFDMYGLVYYDSKRDMEPVAVGGSYFRTIGAIRDPWTHQIIPGQKINKHTTTIRAGRGYRLFIDPNYRRMGLAQDQWLTEAQLYRDCDVYYQRERQTYAALKVTQSIFDDPNKCYILNRKNVDLIRDNDNIKCVMDYRDVSLIKNFKRMPKNLQNFRNKADWRFLKRENLSIEELIQPWYDDGRLSHNGENIKCQKSLSAELKDLLNEFKEKEGLKITEIVKNDGIFGNISLIFGDSTCSDHQNSIEIYSDDNISFDGFNCNFNNLQILMKIIEMVKDELL